MKFLYIDSSALVKLYKPERHSIEVRRQVDDATDVGTSALAEVEVCGALARAQRGAGLDAGDAARLRALFLNEFEHMTVIEPVAEVLSSARQLAERHFLRAYDAVHLASALRLARELGEEIVFLAFDDALNAAAARENLRVPAAQ